MQNIMFLDFMNFAHRARVGFTDGENNVIYNFFRNFRALVEAINPDKIFIVLEGKPIKKINILPEYKAHRKLNSDDPNAEKKQAELQKFFSQVDVIKHLLSNYFPITMVKHPEFECDDTIYNLVMGNTNDNCIIVSNDTDFTQILNKLDNVKIYNPHSKTYVSKPNCCYVTWKALRGDGTDNIKGIKGIGDKTADKLVSNKDAFDELMKNTSIKQLFERNYELIKFADWTDDEKKKCIITNSFANFVKVKEQFELYKFTSITNDKSWNKYCNTFVNVANN